MKISPENLYISSRYRRGQVLQLGADLHRARLRPGGAGRPGRGSTPGSDGNRGAGWIGEVVRWECCEIYRFK